VSLWNFLKNKPDSLLFGLVKLLDYYFLMIKLGMVLGVASLVLGMLFGTKFFADLNYQTGSANIFVALFLMVGCGCFVFWHVVYVTLIDFCKRYEAHLRDTVISLRH
jgi:hypothetical protein